MYPSNRLSVILVLGAISVSSIGCQGDSTNRYRPASATARQALERALSTWKSGAEHGTITDAKPALNVFDARWQAGSSLESYTILEEVTGKPHPYFKVRLKIVGKAEETTEYLVVGIDPLLVFREADYTKAIGM